MVVVAAHSATEGDAVLRAFDGRVAAFESGARGVAGARIVELRGLELTRAVLREGAREDDGRHDGAVDGVRLVAGVDAERVEGLARDRPSCRSISTNRSRGGAGRASRSTAKHATSARVT